MISVIKSNKLRFLLVVGLLILFSLQAVVVNAANEKFLSKTPQFSTNIAVVGAIISLILIIFILEPLPIGILSLTIPVVLVALNSWTKVSADEALSGFSNKATITVMAMFVLSKGIQSSGIVHVLGDKVLEITADNEKRQVGVISIISGVVASFINNTPVVAAFIPMVIDLAHKTKVSPSRLLIPLSYASMLGGTMTLLGTSTNILASQLSDQLIDHPFSMFEFTGLGLIVLVTGILYLVTIGHRLIPKRIKYEEDLITEYEIKDFLAEIVINENSKLIDRSVGDTIQKLSKDIDIVRVIRDGESFMQPLDAKSFRAGDHLIIRTDQKNLLKVFETKGITFLSEAQITQQQLEDKDRGQEVVEVVIPDKSFIINQTISEVNFLERYDATILAIRHGKDVTHQHLKDISLESGDVILLLGNERTLERLEANSNFIIETEAETDDLNVPRIVKSLGIVGSVIALASFNLISIAIAAIGGVVAMVATGCVKPQEVYEAINWEVYFLLAGLIPLGIAIQQTGTADYLASQLLIVTNSFSPVIVLGLFYLLTALLTGVISNNASVVLMLPVAVGAAQQLGANPFAFVLVVTFAASSAFSSPIGYQTNLMIYGPGGYKFRDFIKVGVPLQLLLAVIVPLVISIFWGV